MAKHTRSRGDEAWKLILEHYLAEFLEFFFPDIRHDMEPGHYQFLDNELSGLSRRIGIGKRIADRLVKVFLNGGEEKWLLLHVEIQGEEEQGTQFEERLFVFSYRIYDRHRRDVVTLAVLADDRQDYRPARFEMGGYDCQHLFEFPSVKLRDYRDRIDELEKSTNPFAVVVLAHLRHQETKSDKKMRLDWKIALAKSLEKRGFTEDACRDLLIFIDWLLALPEPLEIVFNETMKRHEEGKNMAYVTSAERIGRKMGKLEGMLEGELKGKLEKAWEVAKKLKEIGDDPAKIAIVTGLSEDEIREL